MMSETERDYHHHDFLPMAETVGGVQPSIIHNNHSTSSYTNSAIDTGHDHDGIPPLEHGGPLNVNTALSSFIIASSLSMLSPSSSTSFMSPLPPASLSSSSSSSLNDHASFSIPPPLPAWYSQDKDSPVISLSNNNVDKMMSSPISTLPPPSSSPSPPPLPIPSTTTSPPLLSPSSSPLRQPRHSRFASMSSTTISPIVSFTQSASPSQPVSTSSASLISSSSPSSSPSQSTSSLSQSSSTSPSMSSTFISPLSRSSSPPNSKLNPSPSHPTTTALVSTRDLLDSLRLLCSGRIFSSFSSSERLQQNGSNGNIIKEEWYVFFDLINSPFDKPSNNSADSHPGPQQEEIPLVVKLLDDEKKENDVVVIDHASLNVAKPASPQPDQGGMLYWSIVNDGHPHKEKLPHQSLPLSSIDSILLGKHTDVFQHQECNSIRDDGCFSILTTINDDDDDADPNDAALPSINLCSKSPIMLVSFLQALKRVIAVNRLSSDQVDIRQVMVQGMKDGVLMGLTPSYKQEKDHLHRPASITVHHDTKKTNKKQPNIPRASSTSLSTSLASLSSSSSSLSSLPASSSSSQSEAQSQLNSQSSSSSSSMLPTPSTSPRKLPQHFRARSHANTTSLFNNLADLSYPTSSSTSIRSLSPLPLDKDSKLAAATRRSLPHSPNSGPAVPKLLPPPFNSLATTRKPASSQSTSPSPSPSLSQSSSSSPSPSPSPLLSSSIPSLFSLLSPGDPSQHFTLLCRLGQGHTGIVYKALHLQTRSHVAIKIAELNRNDNTTTALATEISILSCCPPPYFVRYIGTYRQISTNTIWIVQEYMDGGSLSDFMAITGHALFEVEIAAVMKMCISALVTFHSQNKIHRDIKASNILFSSEGFAKLCDVGVAATTSANRHTLPLHFSPLWLAPEMLSDKGDDGVLYNEKVDIWSLGITAIELATGDPPYHDLPVMQSLYLIQNSPPPQLDPSKGRWSSMFQSFVETCLHKPYQSRVSAMELSQHPFVARMDIEEAQEVLSAMWRAWGGKVDKYRAIEADLHQSREPHYHQQRYLSQPSLAPQPLTGIPPFNSMSLSSSAGGIAASASWSFSTNPRPGYYGPSDWNAEFSESSRSLAQPSESFSPPSPSSISSLSPSVSSLSRQSSLIHSTDTQNPRERERPDTHPNRGRLPRARSMSFSRSLSTYGESRSDHKDEEIDPDNDNDSLTIIDRDDDTNHSHPLQSRHHHHHHPPHDTLSPHTFSASRSSSPVSSPLADDIDGVRSLRKSPSLSDRDRVGLDDEDGPQRSDSDSGFRDISYTAEHSHTVSRYRSSREGEGEGDDGEGNLPFGDD